MRVITGIARGRRLETLEGEDVRPTTDRIKEAVFSIIQFETEGRVFLDLFAGSGQMGIEALSRGAKTAYFVDNAKKSVETLKRNLKTTKLEQDAKVFIATPKVFPRFPCPLCPFGAGYFSFGRFCFSLFSLPLS